MLFRSLFPLVLVAAFISLGERKNRSWFGLIGMTFGILFIRVLSELTFALTVVLTIALVVTPSSWSRRRRVVVVATLTLLVTAYFLVPGIRVLSVRHQLRREFPIESLTERLAFEAQTTADPQSVFARAYVDLMDVSPAVLRDLELQERKNLAFDARQYELSSLHQDEVRAFVEAAGLGVGRMISAFGVRKEDLTPTNLEPLSPLPSQESESFVVLDGQTIRNAEPVTAEDDQRQGEEPSIEPLARRVYYSTDAFKFVPDSTVGYVAGKQQAAGFLKHRFARDPEPVEPDAHGHRWEIVRLELVSLLKFKEARVYVDRKSTRLNSSH